VRIGRGTVFDRAGAEHLAARFELHMDFEADGGNELHGNLAF
jgi:hypothetical protein